MKRLLPPLSYSSAFVIGIVTFGILDGIIAGSDRFSLFETNVIMGFYVLLYALGDIKKTLSKLVSPDQSRTEKEEGRREA